MSDGVDGAAPAKSALRFPRFALVQATPQFPERLVRLFSPFFLSENAARSVRGKNMILRGIPAGEDWRALIRIWAGFSLRLLNVLIARMLFERFCRVAASEGKRIGLTPGVAWRYVLMLSHSLRIEPMPQPGPGGCA